MRLSERLGRESSTGAGSPQHSKQNGSRASQRHRTRPATRAPLNPLEEFKRRVQQELFEAIGPKLDARTIEPGDLRDEVNTHLEAIVDNEGHLLTPAERRALADSVADNLLRLGPIQGLIDDPTVTEIMVNGPDEVYVERNGLLELTDVSFHSHAHIRTIIERIVHAVGRRIDDAEPMVDARTADGSRVNAVLPPLTLDSPTLTIRKFSSSWLGMDDLIDTGSLSHEAAQLLIAAVEARASIVISGGTGSGKTTLLNALSGFVPEGERIITIEDTAELRLQQRHVVRMESRAPNAEGAGQVTIRDLVINALRMRPDRIIVGECRGAEALDMLQAMNTGHEGSITTLHANSPRDSLARLETMVLTTGLDLPHRAIREQIASAIDFVVQLSRIGDGTRRVVDISEIDGIEGDTIRLSKIYGFDWEAGRDATTGAFLGTLVPTGVRPTLTDRLDDLGMELPGSIFDPSLT